jgi:hypothetical protein
MELTELFQGQVRGSLGEQDFYLDAGLTEGEAPSLSHPLGPMTSVLCAFPGDEALVLVTLTPYWAIPNLTSIWDVDSTCPSPSLSSLWRLAWGSALPVSEMLQQGSSLHQRTHRAQSVC